MLLYRDIFLKCNYFLKYFLEYIEFIKREKKNYEILFRNLIKVIKYKNYRFWLKMDVVFNDLISLGNFVNVLKFFILKKFDMLR